MNIKIIAGGIIVIFLILMVTFSWNSGAKKPMKLGELTSLKVSQESMTGVMEVKLDELGKVTATMTTYSDVNNPKILKGVLSSDDKIVIMNTLKKYDVGILKSDPTPPPDATTFHLTVVEGGTTHELSCIAGTSACAKLTNELIADIVPIFSR